MMSGKIQRIALPVGIVAALVAGCGANPVAPPSTEPGPSRAAVTAASPAASARAPSDNAPVGAPANAATPPKPQTAAVGGSATHAPSIEDAVSDDETFPSGLVVDRKLLGGAAPGPELPKGTRILHVGDSFAGALGMDLNKLLNGSGLKSRLEFEKSTYIPTWAHSAKLSALLTSFKPDLVLISLGANELENPEPEKRAPLIQKLVKSLGTTPCVWVAPVLWEGAKSQLLEVIRANVGSCVYLDSNRLVKKMPRAGDRIHPSMAARPDWAVATARWLAYHRKATEQQPWAMVETP